MNNIISKTVYTAAFSLFLVTSFAWADFESALDAGSVEFTAIGRPSMLKIVGKGPGPQGKLVVGEGKASGEFKVNLKELTTGITMRDTHMKEKYLQVEQFPTAEFKLSSLKLPKSLDGKDAGFKDVPFDGSFKIHGVEKPVTGTADLAVESSKLKGTANFTIKLSDFKIDIPKFAGITMAEDVKVTVVGAGPWTQGEKK